MLARLPNTDELPLLQHALAMQREHFVSRPEAAAALIRTGESIPDESFKPTELAAWTMLSNLILNLDETVSRN